MASKKERNYKNSKITMLREKDLVGYWYMWIAGFKIYQKTKHIIIDSISELLFHKKSNTVSKLIHIV